MPSTYTTSNRIEKQAPGENDNSWGELLNEGALDMIDEALDGMVSFTGDKTLSTANGATDESRCRFINITGGTTATVTIPNLKKWYLIRNAGSGAATVTTGSGTTATISAGKITIVISTGSNVVYELNPLAIGVQVQAWDQNLDDLSDLSSVANLETLADLASVANLSAFQGLSLIADRLPYANGTGTLSLATFTSAGRAILDDANAAAQRTTLEKPNGIGFFCAGIPDTNEVIGGSIAAYGFTISSTNTTCKATVAATAQTIFTVKKNGSSIGTLTFAASGTAASKSFSDTSVAAGDYITIHAPASPDATLANIGGIIIE